MKLYCFRKSISELLDFVRRPSFESEFKAEYNRLNGLDARHIVAGTPKGEAQRWTPAKLNRYGNILPYDRNRVILKDFEGEGVMENCDYINASWMRKVVMKMLQVCHNYLYYVL